MSDWVRVSPIIGIVVISLVGVVSIFMIAANEEQTKQEAIKAGLVQDNVGHWVKPELGSAKEDHDFIKNWRP